MTWAQTWNEQPCLQDSLPSTLRLWGERGMMLATIYSRQHSSTQVVILFIRTARRSHSAIPETSLTENAAVAPTTAASCFAARRCTSRHSDAEKLLDHTFPQANVYRLTCCKGLMLAESIRNNGFLWCYKFNQTIRHQLLQHALKLRLRCIILCKGN